MTIEDARRILVYGLALGVAFWFVAILLWRRLGAEPPTWGRTLTVPGRTAAAAIDLLLPFFSRDGVIRDRTATAATLHTRFFQARLAGTDRPGGGSELEVTLDYSARRGMRFWMGLLVWVVQPLVIFGLFLALWFLVAPAETPQVRGQCWQVFQVVHVLWPPFLFYYAARKIRSMSRVMVENMETFLGQGPA